jgi:DNA replication protein DnaC
VLSLQVIAEIRRRHLANKESTSAIARDLKLSRPTVRKHLQTQNKVIYHRQVQAAPKLRGFQKTPQGWLETERHLPKAQRRTAHRLFEGLQGEGYQGAYDTGKTHVATALGVAAIHQNKRVQFFNAVD